MMMMMTSFGDGDDDVGVVAATLVAAVMMVMAAVEWWWRLMMAATVVGGGGASGGEWHRGSNRSGEGEHFWSSPEKSPEKFSGGRRWWPAVAPENSWERRSGGGPNV
ncbi:hypothetical protein Tco_0855812 [Tanacetum coccineum]